MSKFRNYCFTHNNYPDTSLEDSIDCKYIIYGKEIGDSGTPHLQGFISFKSQRALSGVIKALPGCHVEVAASPDSAITYCKKDGDFTERGSWASQAQKGEKEKKRWADARQAAVQGNFDEVPDDIFVTHYGNIKRIRMDAVMQEKREDTEDTMLWYYGASGTGKSRKAREENPDAYLKMCNKWWDGYTEEEVVLIEDFDKKHDVLVHHLKIWGDRYPFPAEVKGGKVNIRPKKIIVTSNYHPSEIWSDTSDLEPILRRFNCIEFRKLITPN